MVKAVLIEFVGEPNEVGTDGVTLYLIRYRTVDNFCTVPGIGLSLSSPTPTSSAYVGSTRGVASRYSSPAVNGCTHTLTGTEATIPRDT